MKRLKTEIVSRSDYAAACYVNTHMCTYGKAVRISKGTLSILVGIIAALPLGTSWMFLLIPKVRDVTLRWGQ